MLEYLLDTFGLLSIFYDMYVRLRLAKPATSTEERFLASIIDNAATMSII